MAKKSENCEIPPEDSESLDHLLRSALEDFDSYSPPSEDINAVYDTTSNETISTENLQSTEEKLQEDFENKFRNLFMKDDMDDAAFSNLVSDLLNEAHKEIQSYVYNPNYPTTDDNIDTVSQAIDSMMQNMEQIKENMKDQTPADGFSVRDTFMEQI